MQKIQKTIFVRAGVLAVLACALFGCPQPVVVTVSPQTASIEVGDTVNLTATSTRSSDVIQWATSSASVASVDSTGVVTGVGDGTATITASGSSSGVSASAEITVTEPVSVTITPTAATVEIGATHSFSATSTDTADTFAWSSNSEGVATVDANGTVTGVSVGSATITATGSNSGESATATVSVTTADTVTVTPAAASVEAGGTVTLTAVSTNTTDSINWSSSNTAFATVNNAGVVSGVAAGEVTITATGSNSGVSGTATITVTAPIEVSVTPTAATVSAGSTIQFTATSTDTADDFTWESGSASVATVGIDGLVMGIAPGSTMITVTGTNSGESASATVTVTAIVLTEILRSFDEAEDYVANIPDAAVPENTREVLIGLLTETRNELLDGFPCEAADTMDSYLQQAQLVRGDLVKRAKSDPGNLQKQEDINYAEWLYGQGRGTMYDMLVTQPEGNPCAEYFRVGMADSAAPEVQSATELEAKFLFGAPRTQVLWDPNQQAHVGLLLPAVQKAMEGEPGTPGLPATRRLVAVPPDSDITIEVSSVMAETFSARIWPFQDQPVDQEVYVDPTISDTEPGPEVYADPPFVRNDNIYQSDAVFPKSLVSYTRLGRFRDMELIQVEVFGGQYNPATDEVTLYESVDIDISFNSNNRGFVTQSIQSPFESSPGLYTNAVLNLQAVIESPFLDFGINPIFQGEEYLIITHPDFRDAADALAAWKNEKGILTHVFEGGTGSGINGRETAAEIDDFIENRYDTVAIKPTYILLLGDSEYIPTYQLQKFGADPGVRIGTDWPYAERSYVGQEFPSLVPTFAVGRIPVDTQQQAQDVVDKIIDYEKTPPGTLGPDAFYNNVTLAAQFQCCRTDVDQPGTAQRTFTEVSEYVRNALLFEGYSVERIYRETVDGDYAGDVTPRRYFDGTPIPADLGPGSGFAWDGDTNDVVDAFNDGRFLILHRDHGWSGGWGTPQFNWNHIPSLTNSSYLPVVYSINCTSGYFDNEVDGSGNNAQVYFAERLLRKPDGGAVGIIGDTRVSPSWPNSALTRGLFDATWPNTVVAFGDGSRKRRLGDILNHAKLYLLTQIGVSGAGVSYSNAYNELLLYHVFGDPTLEMWTSDPTNILTPGGFTLQIPTENGIIINFAHQGARITLFQEGRDGEPMAIGRGTVGDDGEAMVEYFEQPNLQLPLMVSASVDGAVAVTDTVAIPLPDPQK